MTVVVPESVVSIARARQVNEMRCVVLIVAMIVALQSCVVYPGGAALPNVPPDLVVFWARPIWRPTPMGSRPTRLLKQLETRVASSDWKAAVKSAEQLGQHMPQQSRGFAGSPWEWRVFIGQLYLLDLQPERAIQEFDRIWNAPALAKREYAWQQMARQSAACGMARAKAELGELPEANQWLRKALDEMPPPDCGNAAAIRHDEDRWVQPVTAVWARAQLPYERAVRELEAIARRGFATRKSRSHSDAESEAAGKTMHAGVEAGLVLGKIQLRHGQLEKARAAFKLAAGLRFEDASILAESYLRRMEQPQPVVAQPGGPRLR